MFAGYAGKSYKMEDVVMLKEPSRRNFPPGLRSMYVCFIFSYFANQRLQELYY